MWKIKIVDMPEGQSVILFGNFSDGQVIANPGAVLGGKYGTKFILAFPGLGYIEMIDKGKSGSGPGEYHVQLTGSSTDWSYSGAGGSNGQVAVDASGNYTWSGGDNTVTGKMASWA